MEEPRSPIYAYCNSAPCYRYGYCSLATTAANRDRCFGDFEETKKFPFPLDFQDNRYNHQSLS